MNMARGLDTMSETVSFTQMKDGTKEEYELLHELEKPFLALTADRVLEELRRQEQATLEGYRITRLEHGLQSATRAERDGADIDWIVARCCTISATGSRRRTTTGCRRR
jgi:predicted HD phosphohydrolase